MPSSPTYAAINSARAREHLTPPHILVAEDDADMRALVVLALRSDGYSVHEVADGSALLASTFDSTLDLIITDIRMPGLSGLDVVNYLRRRESTIPVIVMTGFGDDDARREAERLGAILFDKPFALDDLRTAVLNLVPPR